MGTAGKTVTADDTYSINMAYNSATGLPESMTYPVSTSGYRLKTKFEYAYGILKRVSDFNVPSTVFWELNAHDERGQPIDEDLGNGARIVTGFDPLTGLIEYRQTGTVAPWTNRQNLSFEWDLNGNLKKRIDVSQSNLTEEFFYDAMNRLDYSQRNGTTNLNLTLDAIGNISAKTSSTDPAENVGTYTYHATKKHAVVSTSNGWSFGYDANGNMNSYKGNSISWTSFNMPNTINAAGQSSQFFYGPNRNRWKQVASYASGLETTIYVGGILEKLTTPSGTAYRHYIGAGSAKVVYTRWSTGQNSTKYVTSDHLNSSTVVMDSAGAALVNLSFASYGGRRDKDWTGPVAAGDMTQISNATRRGYTGHEHLDNLNIVHMNGRVFEPTLGRFLSRDPLIDGVFSSQGPNGYAYVHNSPLTFIDPTGWDHDMTIIRPEDPMPEVTVIGNRFEFDAQRDMMNQTQVWIASFRQFAFAPDGSPEITESSGNGEVTVTARRIDPTPTPTPTFSAGGLVLGGLGIGEANASASKKQNSERDNCSAPGRERSLADQAADAIVGFGDAFYIPILIREWRDISGTIDYNSSAYMGGMVGGTLWGGSTFALRGAAMIGGGGTRFGHVLNHNQFVRTGPGRMPAAGSLPSGYNVPRISLGSRPNGPHGDLRSRLPHLPPVGALAGDSDGCN